MTKRRNLLVALGVAAALTAFAGTTVAVASEGHDGAGHGPGSMAMAHEHGDMGMDVRSEFDFLTQMIPHHEEAIVAATTLREGTQRPEMRELAASIIKTQRAEVKQMKAWLSAWYPGRDTQVDYTPMMRDLTGLRGDGLDRAFLEDMIPHHMMAVMMSQQLVNGELANHDEVVPFAENIRDTQRSEIQTMAGWLRAWFDATPGHMGGGSGKPRHSGTAMGH